MEYYSEAIRASIFSTSLCLSLLQLSLSRRTPPLSAYPDASLASPKHKLFNLATIYGMSEPIDKEWMSEPDRSNTVYSFGVDEAFLKFAEWKLGGEKCRCPCKKCQNRKWFTYKEVGYHLISAGIDKYYRVWTLHGETTSNVVVHPPFVANDIREKALSDVGIGMENPEEEIIGDVGIGMENFIDSAFGLHGDAVRGDGSLGINYDEPYVPEPDFGKRYWHYKRKANEKLYPACEGPETTLSALVELHNVKQKFGWSGNSMTVLLTLLRRWLPKGNILPEKYSVMKGILKDLGMKATCIHACENNCILYWKTNKDLTECPECKAPRFKVNEGSKGRKNSKEPKKIEHILDTILSKKDKSKDTIQGREDMRELGIHRDQWMQTDAASGKQVKPIAPFCLNKAEKMDFLKNLKNLRLPSGFSSNLSNIVSLDPPGLLVMKSHDYHVIMQYLLPVLLQHAFPTHPELRRALHQISLFFNLLCSKVVSRREIQDAKYMVVEALCVLEKKYFPVSFFDISIHLIMHLSDEALMCGPSHTLWMYPFERSMKECKDIPSNKRYVEGSIAESHLLRESVRYAMEYIPDSQHKTTGLDFLDENEEYEGPVLEGKDVVLSDVQFVQIRRWLLFRLEVDGLDDHYSDYRESLQSRKGKGIAKTEVEIQTYFINWLYTKLLKNGDTKHDLWFFVRGPLFPCKSFRKYRINGYVFSTKSHDETVLTQDCGVCMNAITTFTSSRKDKNPIDASAMWYGVIKQILEVNYNNFKEVVFYCDWVRVEDKANGCKLCPDSNLVVVNFNRLKNSNNIYNEPVICAKEAHQVFYSWDLKNPDWWVVIHSPRRMNSKVDMVEAPKPEDTQSILTYQPQLRSLLEPRR
ncbi:hypothetical protein OROMI_003591 [Orobanche minor]